MTLGWVCLQFRRLGKDSHFFAFLSLPFPAFFLHLPITSIISFRIPFGNNRTKGAEFFQGVLPGNIRVFSGARNSAFCFRDPLPCLYAYAVAISTGEGSLIRREGSRQRVGVRASQGFLSYAVVTCPFLVGKCGFILRAS